MTPQRHRTDLRARFRLQRWVLEHAPSARHFPQCQECRQMPSMCHKCSHLEEMWVKKDCNYTCVCVGGVCICTCSCMQVHFRYMQRSHKDASTSSIFLYWSPHNFLRLGLSLNLEPNHLARLARQQAPGTLLSPPPLPSAWSYVSEGYAYTQLCTEFDTRWNLNINPENHLV